MVAAAASAGGNSAQSFATLLYGSKPICDTNYSDDDDGEGDAASPDGGWWVKRRCGRTQLVWVSDAVDVELVVELKPVDTVAVTGSDMQS